MDAEAMFWFAAKCVISYDKGTPRRETEFGEAARLANSPKRYSVLSSRPSKFLVMSIRPRTSSARRLELMAFACVHWSETTNLIVCTEERRYLFFVRRGDEIFPKSILQMEKLLKGKGRLARCSIAWFGRIKGYRCIAGEICGAMCLTRDKW